MSLLPTRVTVTLKENPNVVTTLKTKDNLGVSSVCGDGDVEARMLGIPGPQGEQGIPGDSGGVYTLEPTGFINLSDSTFSIDSATRTFTITPNYTSFKILISGVVFEKFVAESVVFPDIESNYIIYYDSDGVLQQINAYPSFRDIATVAIIYYDATTKEASYVGEERHGVTMDWATHQYLHDTRGCAYGSGLDLSYTENGSGSLDSDMTIGVSDGIIYDEDLRHEIYHGLDTSVFFEQELFPIAKMPVVYRLGLTGDWRYYTPTDYPVHLGTETIQYNDWNGATWSLQEVPNNKYTVAWVFATNNIYFPIVIFMGQGYANTVEAVEEENTYQTLNLGKLPSPEFKMLYRLTIQVRSNYTNALGCRIVSVADHRSMADSSVGVHAIAKEEKPKMNILIDDDDINPDITYIGEALPGTLESENVWAIKRMEAVGDELHILWAESNADYIHVWDDRTTYTYG